jgi:hypothetical protein
MAGSFPLNHVPNPFCIYIVRRFHFSGHLRICADTSPHLQEAFNRLEPVVTQVANEGELLKS